MQFAVVSPIIFLEMLPEKSIGSILSRTIIIFLDSHEKITKQTQTIRAVYGSITILRFLVIA